MTDATLTLDGLEQITGTVETGGDYARLRADTTLDESGIAGSPEGRLTIDGRSERVILENYRALEGSGCEITLRRIQPEPR
ncbi:hypothetical protein PARHAE_00805 [Paracoccus haematequi]|uniref:Uncharacterized protein n=1 Tax=Paracoccus haematequi TaxID=2491866 RepID=A0A447IJF8_9RHOB|nr:hypothetical protein [Paracoccus haematequi]VDS07627.1 hypothetical protein PARHAE_00805 [Paracoccus haematequi]